MQDRARDRGKVSPLMQDRTRDRGKVSPLMQDRIRDRGKVSPLGSGTSSSQYLMAGGSKWDLAPCFGGDGGCV